MFFLFKISLLSSLVIVSKYLRYLLYRYFEVCFNLGVGMLMSGTFLVSFASRAVPEMKEFLMGQTEHNKFFDVILRKK